LEKPATLAVVDAVKGESSSLSQCRTATRGQRQATESPAAATATLLHEQHKAHKRGKSNLFRESELGQYVDRLLTKEIVAITKTYKTSSVVLPKLGDMREFIQSEVQARADQRVLRYGQLFLRSTTI
jgi:hypothetical protein